MWKQSFPETSNLRGNSEILSISCSISSRPVSYSRLLTNDVNINTDMGGNFQQRGGGDGLSTTAFYKPLSDMFRVS